MLGSIWASIVQRVSTSLWMTGSSWAGGLKFVDARAKSKSNAVVQDPKHEPVTNV